MCSLRSAVDLVEHGRQRRRLAAAGRPGDEDEPAGPFGERREDRRQSQILEAFDLFGNQPVDRAHRAALVEHVRAEARDASNPEREVELQRLFEPLLLRVGHDAVRELLRLGRCQIGQLQTPQLAVNTNLRRRVDREVQVRTLPSRRWS